MNEKKASIEGCSYPDCLLDVLGNEAVPIVKLVEGKVQEATNSTMLPFCEYHGIFVKGGLIGAKVNNKLDVDGLMAPFENIRVVEVVLTALDTIAEKE